MQTFLTNAVYGRRARCHSAATVNCRHASVPHRSQPVVCAMSSQSGVSLVEVMVAVLVLSVGFLGIAALQASALANTNSSMARTLATVASYSILDAMRADLVNARANAYDSLTPVKASSCGTTSSTLAGYQVNLWCAQLGSSLGALVTTTGLIACDTGNKGRCTVTITFDDSRVGGAASQTVTTTGLL